MRRAATALRSIALWAMLSAIALASSTLVSLRLPIARRVAAAWLSDFTSREIRGALAISSFSQMSLDAVVARRIVLFDARGRRIIEAEQLTLKPDVGAALHGRVHIASASLQGATVHLIDDGEGLPSLLSTFDSPTPASPASQGKASEPLHVVVDGIEISRVVLVGDLLGLHELRAVDVRASGRLDIGRDVRVRIDRARADLVEPFGFVGHVDALTGTISTVRTEGVALRAQVHRDLERAGVTVRYAATTADPRIAQELALEVDAQRVSAPTLRGLGFDWMPEVAVPLSGRLTLHGPVGDLLLGADLSTDAGDAHVVGAISKERGLSVTISTERLELAQVFTDYPRVRILGSLRLETTPGDPQPTLHLEIEPLLYDTIAVPGFNLDGAITDSGVRIDRIDAHSPGGRITGRGRIEKQGALALTLHASFSNIATDSNLRRFLPGASGGLEADLRISSVRLGQAQLSFDGRIVLRNLTYDIVSAKRLELRGSARGDPEHPRVEIRVTGEQVRLGSYVLGDPKLSMKGGPHEYSAEGQFVSAGRRTFNVSAHMTVDQQGLVIDADPIELTVGEGSWRGALQGLHVVGAQSVELGLLRLANRSQRLEAHGVLRFHGDDELDVQLQDFDLTAVRAIVGEGFALDQGRADAHVQLAGDISDPDLTLQGALRDGRVGELAGIGALYLVKYKAGRIDVDGEVDLGNRGVLQVRGDGRVDRSIENPIQALRLGSYDLELSSRGLALALLPAAKRMSCSGALSGNLRFQGTLQNPNFTGSIELDSFQLAGWSPLTLAADGGYGNGQLSVRLALSDEHGPLATAGGEMRLDWHELIAEPALFSRTLLHGPWDLSGQTTERRLDRLPAPLVKLLPYPIALVTRFELKKQDAVTSGTVQFDANWQETLFEGSCAAAVRPRMRGTLVLARGTSRIDVAVSAGTDHVADFQIDLDTPVDRWAEDGRIERPARMRASGRVAVAAMQRFPYVCEYGSGKLAAQFDLDDGLTPNPRLTLAVDSTFLPRTLRTDKHRKVAARGCEGDPIRAQVKLAADRDNLTASGRMSGCRGGATDVEGRFPVVWDRLLALPTPCENREMQALLRFDGAQLEPLIDRIPGVMNTDVIAFGQVSLSGFPKDIRTGGQLDIENGRLYLVTTGQELTAISARLSFRGDWVKLEHFQAQQGSGRIEAAGGIGFDGLWPGRARLALLATKLPIKREGVDMAWLTGSAAADADITPKHTRVAIKLQQLEVRLPDTTNRVLQPLEPHPEVSVVTEAAPVRETPYPIELMIEGKKKLTVRRNDFNAGIAAEIALSYRDPDLNVGGYITFGSGDFEIFGKRFAINNGALRFDGSNDLNPDVFLVATQKTDVAGISPVTLSVTGTLDEPIVTFSSDVCPGEAGATMYLVSGQCAADDPDLAQASSEAQGAFTTGLVSGVLTLGAQHELSGLSPRFAVERTGLGAQRVKAGFASESLIPKFMRKLVHRVYVEGGVYTPGSEQAVAAEATGTNTNPTPQFLIELYFPHNIVGSGRFASENWGVDMLWEP